MNIYMAVFPLLIGFLLDSLIGDPSKMPHPVRFFGWAISKSELLLNRQSFRFFKGLLFASLFVAIVFFSVFGIKHIISPWPVLTAIIESIGIFYCLANRNLIDECWKVIKILNTQGLDAGRKRLSYIVGRETDQLSEQQIRTAVLETLSENLSDGVIAPLFWYAVGGLPAMFAYKMVNTLDSMIGYKSDRYKQFGCAAARLDDLANLIPARLTAILMSIAAFSPRAIVFALRYGRKHASPNSGYPEAALAGILDCRFGGPNRYHGKLLVKPYIGSNPRELTTRDFWRAVIVNSISSMLMLALVASFIFFFNR